MIFLYRSHTKVENELGGDLLSYLVRTDRSSISQTVSNQIRITDSFTQKKERRDENPSFITEGERRPTQIR